MPDLQSQLIALRDMFRRTGALHQLQLLNLRVWGELAVPHLKLVSVCVVPEEPKAIYEYQRPGVVSKLLNRPPANMPQRLKSLTDNVQLALGGDYLVELKFTDGVAIFTGERTAAPIPASDFSGVDFEAGRLVPATPWKFKKPKS